MVYWAQFILLCQTIKCGYFVIALDSLSTLLFDTRPHKVPRFVQEKSSANYCLQVELYI